MACGTNTHEELLMIFQTSDASIYNSNVKDPIGISISISTLNFMFKLFHVSIAGANIGSPKYYLQFLNKCFYQTS